MMRKREREKYVHVPKILHSVSILALGAHNDVEEGKGWSASHPRDRLNIHTFPMVVTF